MAATKQPQKVARPRTRPTRARAAPVDEVTVAGSGSSARGWTFMTNHTHVLLCVAKRESLTVRDLSLQIGITERSVQGILADLVANGYLTKTKVGRRNSYTVNPSGRLRHPLESGHTVGELISALT